MDGIEYDQELVEIAKSNMKKLGLAFPDGKVKIIHADAAKYMDYGKYNYFYFFNSFSGEILDLVIKRILDEAGQGWFIYHNPINYELIEKNGQFVKEYELFDSVKSYKTFIYRFGNVKC